MKYRGSIVFLGGAAAALCAGWVAFPRVLYKSEAQPIQFSHRVHTGDKVMSKCEDCHSLEASGRFTGIPKLEKCSACHQAPLTDKADEKALIERFVERPRDVGKIHPTRTVCQYAILNVSGTSVLQLDTRGSDDREMPEKVSQTLQLDEQGAATLLKIIRAAFPRLK